MGMGELGFFLCPDHYSIKRFLMGRCAHSADTPADWQSGVQDFVKMGGYDETFDTWRGEDIDIIARMQRIGFRMGFIPTHSWTSSRMVETFASRSTFMPRFSSAPTNLRSFPTEQRR